MAGLDRRTVIKGTAAIGTVFAMPSMVGAAVPRLGIFVADARFQASAAAALVFSEREATVIDAQLNDLGVAWRKRIPDLLAKNGGGVAGVTLWSDLLICQMFARDHDLVLASPPRAVAGAVDGLHYWTLSAPH